MRLLVVLFAMVLVFLVYHSFGTNVQQTTTPCPTHYPSDDETYK